jgi:anti-anti-sigma factor
VDRTENRPVANTPPAPAAGIFEIEGQGDTIIVVPVMDLRELDFQRIEAGGKEILDLLSGGGVRNVIVDFHRTDYYGSTALGFFVKLWKRIRGQDGRMAFCNVSEHEREILQVTMLDRLWPICPTRAEALRAIRA